MKEDYIEEMDMRLQYTEQQRERWRIGLLLRQWYHRYPELFDDKDVTIASSQAHLGYHFFEWLAAIVIYEGLGYLSLVEQYQFKSHANKQAVMSKILPAQVLQLVIDHKSDYGNVQCPDLLVYSPDYSDWFFCEEKDREIVFNLSLKSSFKHWLRHATNQFVLLSSSQSKPTINNCRLCEGRGLTVAGGLQTRRYMRRILYRCLNTLHAFSSPLASIK